MARKTPKGTPLKVFSGKEASLNRVILKILESKNPLITYDIWLNLRVIKGFRNTAAKTVYRRVNSLEDQGWIEQSGIRQAKPGWDSALYSLTMKGRAVLMLDEVSIEGFIREATDEQLNAFLGLFS